MCRFIEAFIPTVLSVICTRQFLHPTQDLRRLSPSILVENSGLEKSAVRLSGTSRFSCQARNFSFSFAKWSGLRQMVRAQAKVNYCKTCPGQAKFESCLSKGQARIQVFSCPETPGLVKHSSNLAWRKFPENIF